VPTDSVLPVVDVVLPTYNEVANLQRMTESILSVLPNARIMVVDDNSPDGTGELAESLASNEPRIEVMHREGKEGLGAAYRAAFHELLRRPTCEVVVQMDCDFSHDPTDLPRLVSRLEDGADLVLGSRYVKGGDTPGWSFKRRLISRGGSAFARVVLLLPYHDLTGGFKAWRSSMLRTIDLESGYANGYGFQIEMTWSAHRANARIAEVPIIFRDRVAGESKMSGKIVREALMMVLMLRWRALVGSNQRRPNPAESP
jgi:dolichol-phosphate mannosyltransferase